jgi:hypothetical protein
MGEFEEIPLNDDSGEYVPLPLLHLNTLDITPFQPGRSEQVHALSFSVALLP